VTKSPAALVRAWAPATPTVFAIGRAGPDIGGYGPSGSGVPPGGTVLPRETTVWLTVTAVFLSYAIRRLLYFLACGRSNEEVGRHDNW
jgi:hypothetical protein